MTGPEHYKMAETLAKVADEGSVDWESTLARAQVHATLALAAATALNDGVNTNGEGGMPGADFRAWLAAAGIREPQS